MTQSKTVHCAEYAAVSAAGSRRDFLKSGPASLLGALSSAVMPFMPAPAPRVALADPHVGPRGDTLVCVFLRGGADGLNIVVPHGDDAYYTQRPTIAIARPDDRGDARTVDLDGFFGLHPALADLKPIYTAADLALVQATGSPDETRSHFEAMDLMERGAVDGEYTGWLARHLLTLDTENESALRALSVGDMLPTALTGALSATALPGVDAYHLRGEPARAERMQAVLADLYARRDDLLARSARQTLAAVDTLQQLSQEPYRPRGRAYPQTEFGRGLQTVGQLIRARVGVEVACVDLSGWDTHVAQGGAQGVMAGRLTELAGGIAAFYEDVQAEIGQVTLVVMSEFGRRVAENAGAGTDHGHGNMMMVLGGGIRGGRVYADWPGLHPDVQVGPGDVHITADYRDVLGELVRARLRNPHTADVFGGYAVQALGLADEYG